MLHVRNARVAANGAPRLARRRGPWQTLFAEHLVGLFADRTRYGDSAPRRRWNRVRTGARWERRSPASWDGLVLPRVPEL